MLVQQGISWHSLRECARVHDRLLQPPRYVLHRIKWPTDMQLLFGLSWHQMRAQVARMSTRSLFVRRQVFSDWPQQIRVPLFGRLHRLAMPAAVHARVQEWRRVRDRERQTKVSMQTGLCWPSVRGDRRGVHQQILLARQVRGARSERQEDQKMHMRCRLRGSIL